MATFHRPHHGSLFQSLKLNRLKPVLLHSSPDPLKLPNYRSHPLKPQNLKVKSSTSSEKGYQDWNWVESIKSIRCRLEEVESRDVKPVTVVYVLTQIWGLIKDDALFVYIAVASISICAVIMLLLPFFFKD